MNILSTAVRDNVLNARASMDEIADQLLQQESTLVKLSQLTKVVNDKMNGNTGVSFIASDIANMELVSPSVLAFHKRRKYYVDKIEDAERVHERAMNSGVSLAEDLGYLANVIDEVKLRFDEYTYRYEDEISFYNMVSSRAARYKPTRIIVSKRGVLHQEKYNRTLLFLILVVIYSVTIYFTLSHSG